MEFESFFSTAFFTFLFLLLILKIVKYPKAENKRAAKLPPGPWKLPLIGNIHQLICSLPHHSLRDLAKKYGPLMHVQLGQVSTVVISSPEIAEEVLKNHDIVFSNRPRLVASDILAYNSTDIIFSPYGDYWKKLRRICNIELLCPKRVHSLRLIREEEVARLIKTISLSEGLPINLSEKVFSLTYGITSRAAFGGKWKDQEAVVSIVKKGVALASGFCLADMYPSCKVLELVSGLRLKLENLHKESDRVLGDILNDHKQKRLKRTGATSPEQEDLVDVLLNFQQDGDLPLTDNNIKAVIFDIFGAGSETSSTTVEWAMSELLKNPRLMKKAQTEVRQVFDAKGYVDETELHELKFIESVVKETLRLHPSAPLLVPRESSEDCVIKGYEIPANTKVIVNGWAIGRDPKYWSEPEIFDPERFLDSRIDYKGKDFEYIPFGAGRRICPGISFAIPNIISPLAQLLYYFDWKLPGGMNYEDLDMTEAFAVTVRRKYDLVLIPISYHPLSIK